MVAVPPGPFPATSWSCCPAMSRDLTVGVLGGLGPEATVDFMAKVIALTGAASDQDHLHLIVDCNPKVPNRNLAIAGSGPSPGPELASMARRLEQAGAQLLVMPCNTAHAFVREIRAGTTVPFVSIIEETVAELRRRRPEARRIGLLTAGGCRAARLYESALVADDLHPVSLDDAQQQRFMELLYAIKAGRRRAAVASGMRTLAVELVEAGAEVVVAGCTEVPLVLHDGDLPCPLIDSTAVLAAATVAYAKRRRPLPAVPA